MGILLYQQLMGNVFGLLVVKGYFFTAALATPVFLSTAGDGPLCFVHAGVRLASGQWLVSEKHAMSHGPASYPKKFVVQVLGVPSPAFLWLACSGTFSLQTLCN